MRSAAPLSPWSAILSHPGFLDRRRNETEIDVRVRRPSRFFASMLAIASILGAPATSFGREPASVARVSPQSVTVEITVPEPAFEEVPGTGEVRIHLDGWGSDAPIGWPELPSHGLLLGVPDGAILRLEVKAGPTRFFPGAKPRPVPEPRIENTADDLPVQFEIRNPDPDAYARSSSTQWAELGSVGRLRHLAIAPVSLRPFRWDPERGGIEMAQSLEITLHWDSAAKTEGRETPRRDLPTWEHAYERTVLNWEQARDFLTSPTGWRPHSLRNDQGGDGPVLRIDIEKTGLYRLRYESLVSSGWSHGPVPIAEVALAERLFDEGRENDPFVSIDIPIRLVDQDENGMFGEGDEIYFWGRNAWDRLAPHPRDRRYGVRYCYFLQVRSEGGARMAEESSTLGRTDLSSETEFLWTETATGSAVYMESVAAGESYAPLEDGVLNIDRRHFYWFGVEPGVHVREFSLPGFRRAISLEVAHQGTVNPPGRHAANPVLSFGPAGGEVSLPSITVPMKGTVIQSFPADSLAALPLAERNRVRLFMADDEWGSAVDYLRWTYIRGFGAMDDRVQFQTESLSGPRQFDLTGFSSSDLVAVDVTDPAAPRVLTYTEEQLARQDGRWRLRIQLALGAGRREFHVVTTSAALAPTAIVATSARDLTSDPDLSGPIDLIVLAHPTFVPNVEPLVARRRENGLRVALVTTEEVFDQFGGGRDWPVGIRNYLRYLFRRSDVDPSYLLLVGDASEDHAGTLEQSAQNFVPAPMLFSTASASNGSELVPCDSWYVDNLTGTSERLDFFLDMHVGRLPVGKTSEAEAVIDKILRYETFRETDTWRNRGLFMADDEFSSRLPSMEDYTWRGDPNRTNPQGDESVFRYAGRVSQEVIQEEAGFADFGIDSFYVACYLDTVACLQRCVPINDPLPPDCRDWQCPTSGSDCNVTAFRTTQTDGFITLDYATLERRIQTNLWSLMSRGHLFVMFNAHGNWAVATHEAVWKDSPFSGRDDSQRLENVEKPFLFFGFGCHMAEFDSYIEAAPQRGDCMSEKMLFLPQGRGAVAACASTGYEWLPVNDEFQLALVRTWFLNPPAGPDGHTRWLLGDLIDGGKLELARSRIPFHIGMIPTYALLGDPSMPVDIAPPRIDRVHVQGSPWDGDRLIAPVDRDSIDIQVWLRDETWISSFAISGAEGAVDSSQYEIAPDPSHPDDDRFAVVRYVAPLDVPLDDYAIEISGVDRAGRPRSISLPVTLEVEFEIQRESGWEELTSGGFVESGDSLRIAVDSPVALESDDVQLLFASEVVSGARIDPDGAQTHRWIVRGTLPVSLPGGEQNLAVRVARRHGAGAAVRGIPVSFESDDVQIVEAFNFPNPFEETTRFHYTLNGSAARAAVTVFTLRGRRIFHATGPVRAGENVIEWDGRDEDRDVVANGVYFYKLEVVDLMGREHTHLDRIARVR